MWPHFATQAGASVPFGALEACAEAERLGGPRRLARRLATQAFGG